jgi:Siphovirus Gp157
MSEVRPPSSWQIEKTVTAWLRAQEMLALDPELQNDENRLATALQVDPTAVHPDELIRRLIDAIAWAETREEAAEKLMASMKDARDRYAKRVEAMRETLLELMQIMGHRRFDDPETLRKAVIGRTNPAAVILDEGKLPAEYIRIKREPNKQLIRDDLMAGVVIPGAVLSNSAPSLQLRKP